MIIVRYMEEHILEEQGHYENNLGEQLHIYVF